MTQLISAWMRLPNEMSARKDEWVVSGLCPRWKFVGVLLGSLVLGAPLMAQDTAAGIEPARLRLFPGHHDTFQGSVATRDYFLRLPEHILFRNGAQVEATLHPSELLLPAVCAIGLAVNDRLVVSTNLHAADGGPAGGAIPLRAAVPREVLSAGWNKVSLRFTLHPAKDVSRDVLEKASWTLRSSESFLEVAFERQFLFPELARFPHTLTEEKLLHPDRSAPFTASIQPAVSILVPGRSRQAHLRAAAIVGARLGQVGYIEEAHCRVQAIEFWKTETDQRNAILIARRDQLGGVELPEKVATAAAGLRAGQGLLAEYFVGASNHQHRVLLLTGADDNGLEQAALTIGSSPALDAAPPSPSVIEETPSISAALEKEARPSPGIVGLGTRPLEWRGLYRSEQSFAGWRLPPGFQAGSGSGLALKFSYAPPAGATHSSLEALVNGASIGTIQLGDAPTNGTARLPLPTDLPGRDPMLLTFRASLDGGDTACGQAVPAQSWLKILPESQIESSAVPAAIAGLQHLNRLLTQDRFGRRAAFVLPDGPGLDQVRLLFALAFSLGQQLPNSPVLWPEVVTYRTGGALDRGRLKGHSVVLLGSVAQWAEILDDASASPAVALASAPNTVVIQGREYPMDHFDPAMAILQFLPSPWDSAEKVVIAGGWHGYTAPTVKQLLCDFASGELQGDLAALIASGVVVSYHSTNPQATSFADRIARPQTSEPAIAAAPPVQPAAFASTRISNLPLFYGCGSVLAMLVAARLLLMWEQARIRERAMAADRATGGHL